MGRIAAIRRGYGLLRQCHGGEHGEYEQCLEHVLLESPFLSWLFGSDPLQTAHTEAVSGLIEPADVT